MRDNLGRFIIIVAVVACLVVVSAFFLASTYSPIFRQRANGTVTEIWAAIVFPASQNTTTTPTPIRNVSTAHIQTVLHEVLGNEVWLEFTDEQYTYCNYTDMRNFVASLECTRMNYTSERDCDNFAFAMKGEWAKLDRSYPVGVAFSNTHAFNIFVDDADNVWVIEPRGGIIHNSPNGQYKPIWIIM